MSSTYEKRQKTLELAKHYGIDLNSYSDDGNHRTNIGDAGWNQLQRDVANAGSNDYDLREFLTASANSGKNKTQQILKEGWNYKDLSNLSKALNVQEKTAKKHGQGGNFSSASDRMGLTRSIQDKERNIFRQDIENSILDSLSSSKNKDENNKEKQPRYLGSYEDWYPETLEEATDKATNGFNADGTPAQRSADELLTKKVNEIAEDSDKQGLSQFRQGMFVLSELGKNEYTGNYA